MALGRPLLRTSYEQDAAILPTVFQRVALGLFFLSVALMTLGSPFFGAIPQYLFGNTWLTPVTIMLCFAVAALGINILVGVTGQVSLGHAFFMGTGAYTAVTNTFAAGDQVPSATLNAIQAGIVDVSEALDDVVVAANATFGEQRSASANLTDSPAPDAGGAMEVWVERPTNSTTLVVLDASADWRDRYIIVKGTIASTANDIAGGSADNAITAELNGVGGTVLDFMWYSRDGQTGATASTECHEHTVSAGNVFRFFARSTDGALCMLRTTAGTDLYVVASFRASPAQNHY